MAFCDEESCRRSSAIKGEEANKAEGDRDRDMEEDDVDCERTGGALVLIDRNSGEKEIGVEFQSMEPMRAQTSCYLSDDCVQTMPSPAMKPETLF